MLPTVIVIGMLAYRCVSTSASPVSMWPNVMKMVAAVCEQVTGDEANSYFTLQFCIEFVGKEKKITRHLSSHSSRPCRRRLQSTTTAPQPMRNATKKTKEEKKTKEKKKEEEAPFAAVLG